MFREQRYLAGGKWWGVAGGWGGGGAGGNKQPRKVHSRDGPKFLTKVYIVY